MERKRWSDNLRNFLINATTKETKEDDQRRKVKLYFFNFNQQYK